MVKVSGRGMPRQAWCVSLGVLVMFFSAGSQASIAEQPVSSSAQLRPARVKACPPPIKIPGHTAKCPQNSRPRSRRQ